MKLPVSTPFKITSPYGNRILQGKKQFHDGIDFVGNDNNVYAVAEGICVYDMDNYSEALRWIDPKHSAGNMVILRHVFNDFVYFARYMHLAKNCIAQKEFIRAGEKIGEYADVGFSFGAHLHFDMYDKEWKKIDPTPFFKGLL